jgi:hypothetical protein
MRIWPRGIRRQWTALLFLTGGCAVLALVGAVVASGWAIACGLLALLGVSTLLVLAALRPAPRGLELIAVFLVGFLLLLMVDGLILTALQVRITHRSASLSLVAFSIVIGGVALWRQRPVTMQEAAPASDLDRDVDSDVDTRTDYVPRRLRSPGKREIGYAALLLLFLAGAISISLLSNSSYNHQDGFIRLTASTSTDPNSGDRVVDVTVASHNEESTSLRLSMQLGAEVDTREVRVDRNGTVHIPVSAPRSEDLDVRLYRLGQPSQVYREVHISGID